ncbi:TPA: glycosyltransferase [Klebsiella pneumoniae]|uniref:CgeB family protein n=1 Tax=Aeromonas veronii TaxID=654 RepID=UPI00128E5543|nr:glycosyltransferase [Aeromonas veronii]MCF5910717.1 glycosyltransferase [Aeromonas veronii]MQA51323.1 glycosyltransferase [Klebsiella pneumoniae]
MKILYIGASSKGSTSRHRADALERLGHQITIYDPYLFLKPQLSHKVFGPLHFRSGYRFLQNKLICWIKRILINVEKTDLIWVDNGELFGDKIVQILGENDKKIILYNHDDPTGGRDGHRFDSLIKAIPFYSACTVVRNLNIDEFYNLRAKKVIKVWMSYDELVHSPFENKNDIDNKYIADVVFIGTWMRHEGRDKFLLQLIDAGLNVRIWGQRWEKSPYWSQLKEHVAGGALSGRDYVAAIQGAKVCLGLLSKGNRDLHTTRSMEIPYAGGVFCAQRTTEHLELYQENVEAVFWDDVDECISQCKKLVTDDLFRESVRSAGMQRVRKNKLGHEDQCRIILNKISELS